MANNRRHVDASSASGSASLDAYHGPWPSKNNCTEGDENGSAESGSAEYWWERKNEIVDHFIEKMPNRAARPISVRGGTKLREECALEKNGDTGGYRSRSWSAVLSAFLTWFNGYRDASLVFKNPKGDEVRCPMENSHQPNYGDRYYARLKALERQVVKRFDEPYSVMLTFSGSSRNANGGWRCPADHLRDVVESWRPKSGRGVYQALRQALNGRRWEYAIVVEKHKSGYAHVHCAVFVDGAVEEKQFHTVIDAHIRTCSIAGSSAHDYNSPNENNRPISVKRINPNAADEDSIGNLGSYIGEYIGAYGKPLFDRGLDELIFRAAAWATGTQIVRFSTGANEMIRQDWETGETEKIEETIESNSEFDPEIHAGPGNDVLPFEIANPDWMIVGIARGSGEDERLFDIKQGTVEWVEIEDASRLDPPVILSSVPSKDTCR